MVSDGLFYELLLLGLLWLCVMCYGRWPSVRALPGLTPLAGGAVPELCVRPGMRVLTEKDGFPALGTFDIGLVRKPGRTSSAVEALTRHVTESLSNLSPAMMAAE